MEQIAPFNSSNIRFDQIYYKTSLFNVKKVLNEFDICIRSPLQ